MKSWRTTVCGVLAAISGLIPQVIAMLDSDPNTTWTFEGIAAAVTGILIALGLVAARDNKVTSEEAGAK